MPARSAAISPTARRSAIRCPALIALGARVSCCAARPASARCRSKTCTSRIRRRTWRADEFVVGLKVPTRTGVRANLQFRTYKLSKRFDSGHFRRVRGVLVHRRWRRDPRAAHRVRRHGGDAEARGASRSRAADAAWHEATAQAAMLALGEDYAPLTDMRASSNYRLKRRKNLCTASGWKRVRTTRCRSARSTSGAIAMLRSTRSRRRRTEHEPASRSRS